MACKNVFVWCLYFVFSGLNENHSVPSFFVTPLNGSRLFNQKRPLMARDIGKLMYWIKMRGETSPNLFENRKWCPDFGKKGPGCVHLWANFPIQNTILRLSRRKNSKMFPCRLLFSGFCFFFFFLFFWRNVYQSAQVPQSPLPALKNFWLRTCTYSLFFLQNAPS